MANKEEDIYDDDDDIFDDEEDDLPDWLDPWDQDSTYREERFYNDEDEERFHEMMQEDEDDFLSERVDPVVQRVRIEIDDLMDVLMYNDNSFDERYSACSEIVRLATELLEDLKR